jgi:redox-sensitive bicupin YhaK (pirin superfamily)
MDYLKIWRHEQRFHTQAGWLNSYFSFSFDQYFDPARMQFGSLRVFNDDTIAPASGFPMHPHRNMEILTYVLQGTLAHEDSMGTQGRIHAGSIQRMSAGTGILHSEMNPDETEPVHLYQMWFLPHTKDLKPEYEQKDFSWDLPLNQWMALASGSEEISKKSNTVFIHQDLTLWTLRLQKSHTMPYHLNPNRKAYVQIIQGKIKIEDQTLKAGDAAEIAQLTSWNFQSVDPESRILLIDLV